MVISKFMCSSLSNEHFIADNCIKLDLWLTLHLNGLVICIKMSPRNAISKHILHEIFLQVNEKMMKKTLQESLPN